MTKFNMEVYYTITYTKTIQVEADKSKEMSEFAYELFAESDYTQWDNDGGDLDYFYEKAEA